MSDIEHELIATQWDLKVAKERIELLMSANADVARIAAERDAAEKRVLHLEAALRKIADQDYRGPRSTESEIALRALDDKPCIKQLKTKSCIYCMKVECECSDFDVSADMGAKG